VCIINEHEMLQVIEMGDKMRTVGATHCNKHSSRSHTIFLMEIRQKFSNDTEKRGVLNLVDLAGSEKIKKSKVQGKASEETRKIN